MVFGMFIAALAFIVCAFVELAMEVNDRSSNKFDSSQTWLFFLFFKQGYLCRWILRLIQLFFSTQYSSTQWNKSKLSKDGTFQQRVSAWNDQYPDDTRDLSTMDKEHQLHVLTMIPQIFLITCAEILCSITVLEFAYAYVSYPIIERSNLPAVVVIVAL